MFELTYHHSLGNFFQLAIRNSVMQPCAAFHSLWRLCFTGDSSPEQVVYTCCLGRNTHNTHTHTQFQKWCPYSNAYIHTDVVSNGILTVDPPMYPIIAMLIIATTACKRTGFYFFSIQIVLPLFLVYWVIALLAAIMWTSPCFMPPCMAAPPVGSS